MTRPVQPLGTYGQIAVRKTAPGRFVASARYRDEDGQYVRITSTSTTSQMAVNALKAKIADHVADGEQGDPHRNTLLPELAEFWLAEVHPTNARQARVVLGLLMKVAVRYDAIDRNRVRDFAPVPQRRKDVRALDQTQLDALCYAVRGWRRDQHVYGPRPDGQLSDVIETILGTSARIGEALAIRVCDVDLTASPPTVTISGTLVPRAGHPLIRQPHPMHSKHRRIIAVPSYTADALRQRIAGIGAVPADLPVLVTRNGTVITPNNRAGSSAQTERKLAAQQAPARPAARIAVPLTFLPASRDRRPPVTEAALPSC